MNLNIQKEGVGLTRKGNVLREGGKMVKERGRPG